MEPKPKHITAILNVRNSRVAETIYESIGYKGTFTHVSDVDPRLIAPKGLTLLSLRLPYSDPELRLCILIKNNRVATGQARVKGFKVLQLGSLTIEQVLAAVPDNLRQKADSYLVADYQQFSSKLGEEVYQALLVLQPDMADQVNELYEQLQPRPSKGPSPREQDAAIEKDALGLTLDIFGIDRANVFRSWQSSGNELGESFLSGLDEFTVYEDDAIAHDLHVFPGLGISKQDITGVVEFESEDGERLTVINANRKPLEKAMGVDLIYFHRRYESFVMVQYKMMDQRNEEHDSFYYNPNQPSHEDELQRLQRLRDLIGEEKKKDNFDHYRLTDSMLFFKLCKKIELKKTDHSLAPGMYIPLEEWEHLLQDSSIIGKKGGRQLGYHTLKKRYLHKDTFVNLVRSGMIGTAGDASQKIAAFIQDAIAKGHSVMYAMDERLKEPLSIKQNIKRRTIEDDLIEPPEPNFDIDDDDLPF
jgi:hypothetical protein